MEKVKLDKDNLNSNFEDLLNRNYQEMREIESLLIINIIIKTVISWILIFGYIYFFMGWFIMAIEILETDITKEIEEIKKKKDNIIGCRIKFDDNMVKVTIPERIRNGVFIPEEELTFSKREVKELLQDLYTQ